VNLYPFERTAAMPGIGFDEIMEMIDVGGPTMVRAAAKKLRHVAVLVDPLDYPRALEEIRRPGRLSEAFRFELAKKAFRHVAAYDTAIFAFLSRLRPDGTLSAGGRDVRPTPRS
jgi:phosphoribosylaminoimidazolecarboxamide formyltransferase/IMP cyclohydrolase